MLPGFLMAKHEIVTGLFPPCFMDQSESQRQPRFKGRHMDPMYYRMEGLTAVTFGDYLPP